MQHNFSRMLKLLPCGQVANECELFFLHIYTIVGAPNGPPSSQYVLAFLPLARYSWAKVLLGLETLVYPCFLPMFDPFPSRQVSKPRISSWATSPPPWFILGLLCGQPYLGKYLGLALHSYLGWFHLRNEIYPKFLSFLMWPWWGSLRTTFVQGHFLTHSWGTLLRDWLWLLVIAHPRVLGSWIFPYLEFLSIIGIFLVCDHITYHAHAATHPKGVLGNSCEWKPFPTRRRIPSPTRNSKLSFPKKEWSLFPTGLLIQLNNKRKVYLTRPKKDSRSRKWKACSSSRA